MAPTMKAFLSTCLYVLPLSVLALILYVFLKGDEPTIETSGSNPQASRRAAAPNFPSSALDDLRRELREVRLELQGNPHSQESAMLKEAKHESDPRTIGAKTNPPINTTGSQIIAEKYVKAIHFHQWESAADMIATESLERLKWFQRAHLYKAPTMQEEQDLLELLGIKDISGIDQLAPRDVFIRRGQAQTSRLPNPVAYLKEIGKNLVLKSLGAVPDQDAVHLIIRKEFIAKNKAYSELAFISVIKENGNWKISLDAQEPVIRDTGKQQ